MSDPVRAAVERVRAHLEHFAHCDPASVIDPESAVTLNDLRTLAAVAEAARAFIAADVALGDRPQSADRIIRRTTALNKLDAAVAAMGATIKRKAS